MRALLLEYLAFELFELPLHHLTLYDKLKTFYQNFQNADIYMKDIDLPEVLRELQKLYPSPHAATASPPHRALWGRNW